MDELLARVLDAHGGADNWSYVRSVTADVFFAGPFWAERGWPEIHQRQTVRLDPRLMTVAFTPFTGDHYQVVFDGDPPRVRVESGHGEVLERRSHPLPASLAYDASVGWDLPQLAYFLGTWCWYAFTEPFVFAYPGVEAEEIAPWREGDQTWRRLAVRFPPDVPNPHPDQVLTAGSRDARKGPLLTFYA